MVFKESPEGVNLPQAASARTIDTALASPRPAASDNPSPRDTDSAPVTPKVCSKFKTILKQQGHGTNGDIHGVVTQQGYGTSTLLRVETIYWGLNESGVVSPR